MTSEREAYIYIQLPGTLDIVPAAVLRVLTLRDGTRVGRFRYGDRYLNREDAVSLDPFKLPLTAEVFEFTALKGIPGAVRDAAPDAWGRRVIEYRLGRAPEDLDEIDYLLHGPQDGAGYLSFGLKAQPPAPVRAYNQTHQLERLVAVAQKIEDREPVAAELLQHLQPGTSLGGARPKATLEDAHVLHLAKFPLRGDRVNLQRIELATLALAARAGINTVRARIERIGSMDVLLLERFDRQWTPSGYHRFGMVSGLTLLDAGDSHLDRDRWSYPLLADSLRRWVERPLADCAELFRRMAFNAAVTNDDDHPRNHALIRAPRGWRLAPAYDLVPSPKVSIERRDLALTVGRYGRAACVYNLISHSKRFGLEREARSIVEEVIAVVRQWREVYASCGVSPADCEAIAPAFLPEGFFYEAPPPVASWP
jgi:serine/threonine-protein kinase HipA